MMFAQLFILIYTCVKINSDSLQNAFKNAEKMNDFSSILNNNNKKTINSNSDEEKKTNNDIITTQMSVTTTLSYQEEETRKNLKEEYNKAMVQFRKEQDLIKERIEEEKRIQNLILNKKTIVRDSPTSIYHATTQQIIATTINPIIHPNIREDFPSGKINVLGSSAILDISHYNVKSSCHDTDPIDKKIFFQTGQCKSESFCVFGITGSMGYNMCPKTLRCGRGYVTNRECKCVNPSKIDCSCPLWADQCSLTVDHSSFTRLNCYNQYKSLFLDSDVCSFSLNKLCSFREERKIFLRVQILNQDYILLDQTVYDEWDKFNDSLMCVGEKTSSDLYLGGDALYCSSNKCNFVNATGYCFFRKGITKNLFLRQGNCRLYIDAWARIEYKYYPFKTSDALEPLLNDYPCINCFGICEHGYVSVNYDPNVITRLAIFYLGSISETIDVFSNATNVQIDLPKEINDAYIDIKIIYERYGKNVKEIEFKCIPVDKCEILHCEICYERFSLYQCWNILQYVIIPVFCIFILTFLSIFYSLLICIFSHFDFLLRCLTIRRKKQGYAPVPLYISLIFIFILSFTQVIYACDELFVMRAPNINCVYPDPENHEFKICSAKTDIQARFETPMQTLCILGEYVNVSDNQTQETFKMEIQLIDVHFKCDDVKLYHTRSVKGTVDRTPACYSEDMCQDCINNNINHESMMNTPFGRRTKFRPGIYKCKVISSMFVEQGSKNNTCYPLFRSPCVIWKQYLYPSGNDEEDTYRVFHCVNWIPVIKLRITTTDSVLLQSYTIQQGQVIHVGPITIKLGDLSSITDSISKAYFMSNKRRVIKVSHVSGPGTPVRGTIGMVQFDNLDEAQRYINPKYSDDFCTCDNNYEKVMCDCTGINLYNLISNTSILPVDIGSFHLQPTMDNTNNINVNAYLKSFQSLSLMFTSVDMKVYTKSVSVDCNIEVHSITGCYSCSTGARLNYTCTTSAFSRVGAIRCDGRSPIPVYCSNDTNPITLQKWQVARFMHSSSTVNMRCQFTCSKTNEPIPLVSVLSEEAFKMVSTFNRYTRATKEEGRKFEASDIPFLQWIGQAMDKYSEFVTYTLISLIIIILLLISIYFFIKFKIYSYFLSSNSSDKNDIHLQRKPIESNMYIMKEKREQGYTPRDHSSSWY